MRCIPRGLALHPNKPGWLTCRHCRRHGNTSLEEEFTIQLQQLPLQVRLRLQPQAPPTPATDALPPPPPPRATPWPVWPRYASSSPWLHTPQRLPPLQGKGSAPTSSCCTTRFAQLLLLRPSQLALLPTSHGSMHSRTDRREERRPRSSSPDNGSSSTDESEAPPP